MYKIHILINIYAYLYKYISLPYYTNEGCFCGLNPLLWPVEALSNLKIIFAHGNRNNVSFLQVEGEMDFSIAVAQTTQLVL